MLLDCLVLGSAIKCQCLWCVRIGVYRDYAEHGELYECENAVVGSGSDGAMRIWSSAGL